LNILLIHFIPLNII